MKKIISGIIFGLITGLSLSVFGAQFVAEKAGFDIFLNGRPFTPDNPAVAINGITYLPLRAVGDALGVRIAWNQQFNRVEIGETKPSISGEITKVTRVLDGTTFEIDDGEKVKLTGVDIPEWIYSDKNKNTEFGEASYEYAKSILEGKNIYMEKDVSNTDRYGRLLRYVYLEDGTFFNELLVKEGYAKAYRYPPDVKFSDVFAKAEKYARENKKGLWAIVESQEESRNTAEQQGKIKGNINSRGEKIYHVPGGAFYDRTDAEEYFDTEAEAQAAGYRKSKR